MVVMVEMTRPRVDVSVFLRDVARRLHESGDGPSTWWLHATALCLLARDQRSSRALDDAFRLRREGKHAEAVDVLKRALVAADWDPGVTPVALARGFASTGVPPAAVLVAMDAASSVAVEDELASAMLSHVARNLSLSGKTGAALDAIAHAARFGSKHARLLGLPAARA